MKKILWKEEGWTTIQEADAKKHILEISCLAEGGNVVEVRIRHNDGEEQKGKVTKNGENVLPVSLSAFKKLYEDGELDIK